MRIFGIGGVPAAKPCGGGAALPTEGAPAPARRRALPGGRAGEPYRAVAPGVLRLLADDALPSTAATPEGAATGALQLSLDGELTGTLSVGEHSIPAEDADGPVLLEIFIAPDPRSLWQDHPSDGTVRGWKPDRITEDWLVETVVSADTPASRPMRLASRRGRSHAHAGGFREDDGTLLAVAGWQALIVADGAGSAPLSRLGSALAATAAAASLRTSIGDATLVDAEGVATDPARWLAIAAAAALDAIEADATTHAAPTKDYATTLLVALFDAEAVHCLHIGDGLVAFSLPAGTEGSGELTSTPHWQSLTTAERGDFSNETRFLDAETVADVATRITTYPLPHDATLWAMTDGVSDAFLEDADDDAPDAETGPNAFLTRFATPAATGADALLEALDFFRPGCHDDATLAVALPLSREP